MGSALSGSAGGRANRRAEPKRLIVDMREFMSHLPAVLHQQGLEIVPVTLEVRHCIGDSVLLRMPVARGAGVSRSAAPAGAGLSPWAPAEAGHRACHPGGQSHTAGSSKVHGLNRS